MCMNKPGTSQPQPLSALLHKTLGDAFAKRGFASAELITRWSEIVGAEIAEHSQPEKIQWLPPAQGRLPEPGRLVLRVEGPVALEIQHLSGIILERVNRFFGWQAVGAVRLRQAPLRRPAARPHYQPDPEATARIAASLADIEDPHLRDALARLKCAIKPP
jgi:hypothetical protein